MHLISKIPRDPLRFWQTLHPRPINGFFLGPVSGRDSDIYMSAGEPRRVLSAGVDGVNPLLAKIKASFRPGSALPRFVGFLGFNAGRAFDAGIGRLPLRPNPLGTPEALFGDYPLVVKLDLKKKETLVAARSGKGNRKKLRTLSSAQFARMVDRAKDAIAQGDIYQANLSLRFSGGYDGDPIELYRSLSEQNPSPYSCLIKFGNAWIVSSSPELLVQVDGRRVLTRPIAGTRPRGMTASIDARRRGQLLLSPKERAEHIMLVDLERNDLGRVCRAGSVKVTDRYAVERYSHVMHIVSQVEGRLGRGRDSVDALKALFPGGTITGCPKIKSIEVIEEIEKVARGPFYGSAGFFRGTGDAVFNILIRTALIKNKKITIQAGAGIVADSNAGREYREVLAKAGALLEAVGRT